LPSKQRFRTRQHRERHGLHIIAGPNGKPRIIKRDKYERLIRRYVSKDTSPKSILRLPLQKRAELAVHKAVEGVIEEHVRLGLPLYIGHEGKVVELSPNKLRRLYRSTPHK
jgi:hypothetical protein